MSKGRIALSLLLLCAPLAAQEPDFDELWRIGSLWQVGDNRDKVDAARKAIIDAGAPGLKHALTRLGASDGLEIRCLHAVIEGFGEKAVDPLIANIAHEDATARRNVAELLAVIDGRRSADALLARAGKEDALPARLAQLAALSKWKVREALPLVLESSRGDAERARLRCVGMLAEHEDRDAAGRLMAMLEDRAYYVRAAAVDALKKGTVETREDCLKLLEAQLPAPEAEQNTGLTRRLLPIVATLAGDKARAGLQAALKHNAAQIRGDAAKALADWKRGAGSDDKLDIDELLKHALKNEDDPYVRTEIESARKQLERD